MHDWFKQRGQGFGGEYRYAAGPGSNGYAKFYNLREHESTYTDEAGNQTVLPARTSYEVRSSASHALGRRWTARGRVDYFTDITVNQAYNTDIYDTSRSSRMYGGGISGSLQGFSVNGTYDRTEYFAGLTDSTVTGSSPRVTVSRNEKPLFGAPGLLRRQHRVREPRAPEPVGRRRDRRPKPPAVRRHADDPRAVHQAALPDRQLVGRLARHLVDPQPVAGRLDGARPGDPAVVLRPAVARDRPGAEPRLEHPRQRLRLQVEARGRAVLQRPVRDVGRQLRRNRPARRHRLHRRRRPCAWTTG